MSLSRPVRQPRPAHSLAAPVLWLEPESGSQVLSVGIAARGWGAGGACCPVFLLLPKFPTVDLRLLFWG